VELVVTSYVVGVAAVDPDPWIDLPRRVFLDSSTLQTLHAFGGVVFEREDPPEAAAAHAGLGLDLEALRRIFAVNERALFEFVLSQNSLHEVEDKHDPRYRRWALDVLDHWEACVDAYENREAFTRSGERLADVLNESRFGYLGQKDRRLLVDAVAYECDAFLTMEKKLPNHSAQIEQATGLRILRPPDYWALLKPWASLYL
jgi:hypothetical protein